MKTQVYKKTIDLYCTEFLPEAMKHFDPDQQKILDATGHALRPDLSDENPYYKGFIIMADGDDVWSYMSRMITRDQTGPREPIPIKTGADFKNYFGHTRASDLVYFLDTDRGIMRPVKGQLKNSYDTFSDYPDGTTIDSLLQTGSLPSNYLHKEGVIPVSDIGGRSEAAIINSAKYPNMQVILANQRAYSFGMGKVSLLLGGKLFSDFRFELGGDVEVYPGVSGVMTFYKQLRNRRVPVGESNVYYEDNHMKFTPRVHLSVNGRHEEQAAPKYQ